MDSASNSAYSLTDLTPILDELGVVLSEFEAVDLTHRLNERDFTLWSEDPSEIADRLGWLDCPSSMRAHEQRLRNFRADIVAEAYDRVVVLGMGGSSLFPEVLALSGAASFSGPELSILDSTHPAAVKRCVDLAAQHKVLFVAASKSGGTIETRSQLDCLWDAVGSEKDFVAITDPGTELAMLAHDRQFRACFENPADIGGRYSALSLFGLVPAAACGLDVSRLLSGGVSALQENGLGSDRVPMSESPGILLGAALAAAERSGRNKLTLLFGGAMVALNVWVEQLIAESSGKQGRGLLPVVDEWILEGTDGEIKDFSHDRIFVAWGFRDQAVLDELVALGHPVINLGLDAGLEALGREVMRWEIAAATLGVGLGTNPFDQPDVGAAKSATAEVLQSGAQQVRTDTLADLLAGAEVGDYVALLAYVDSGDARALRTLRKVRSELSRRYKVPVTLGIGPRYLHSTGQFHKGGAAQGRFIQIVEPAAFDIRVPGTYMRFGQLMNAQADGDIKALADAGRPVTRVDIQDLEEYLAQSG
jgi:glucose-6-phosphate isomerase